MRKIYKSIEGVLYYHEAWAERENGVVVEHWGAVGEKGQVESHPLTSDSDEEKAVEAVLLNAIKAGYEPFDEDELKTLMVEYAVKGMGTDRDLDKRHELEGVLNECLGWAGLGHCDGGSIGSGTMEACCYVVDFSLAKKVIEEELKGTRFSDYTRIYDEDA